uniref:Uncharacterized protein LOC113796236 n=1 Tax=Dermatophagoides pteronyssinus TaxID=6956 RepID=A0A6P6YAE6_DERPT|nr:uncharacterized protein LOC113796236 [Dermatophagoides pteronyssinus]
MIMSLITSSETTTTNSKLKIRPLDQTCENNFKNTMMMLKANNNHLPISIPSSSTSTSSASTSIIRPLTDLIDGQILNQGDIIGPISNLCKWLRNELDRIEQCLQRSSKISCSSSTIVETAMSKLEQNLEIIYLNEQYYLEVIRSFRCCQQFSTIQSTNDNGLLMDEKPKAWFNHLIEESLTTTIRPIQTWINGKELFGCLWCNHFSFYSNHMILHIMMDCMKHFINISHNNFAHKNGYIKFNETIADSANHQLSSTEQQCRRKQIRSFDIVSLLNQKDRKSTLDHNVDQDNDYDYDNQDADIEVDVETLDEDNSDQMIKPTMMMNMNGQKQRSKRSSSIVSNQNRIPPSPSLSSTLISQPIIRGKYNRKSSSNNKSNANVSSTTNNQSKSAFKKLKTIKAANKLATTNQSTIKSNQFLSNLNMTNFYSQISTEQSSNACSFPLANLFNNQNDSPITSVNSSSTSPKQMQHPIGSSKSSPISVQPTTFESNTTTTAAMNNSLESSGSVDLSIDSSSSSSYDSHSPDLAERSSSTSDYNNVVDRSNNKQNENDIVSNADESSSSSLIQLLPQSSVINNPLMNLPPYFMPPTTTASSAANNPLITSLYLLSPSLTALSYQASNVCAYCNQAFRMTSDLVYHMRSHHKRTKAADDLVNKKRRDDQLRCHICNETFRERHHLTRHMTSHQ